MVPPPVTPPKPINLLASAVNNTAIDNIALYSVSPAATIKLSFSVAVLKTSAATAISLTEVSTGTSVPVTTSFENGDAVVVVQPINPLKYLTKYGLTVSTDLSSADKIKLTSSIDRVFITQLDSSRKFPLLSDDALLDKIQQQTFKYFWDFGHPVSGLARERNSSGETVTSGGSGFAVMAIITAINRNFITRAQGLTRLQTITGFFKKYRTEISWCLSALVEWYHGGCYSL